jgi:hypothetical protein
MSKLIESRAAQLYQLGTIRFLHHSSQLFKLALFLDFSEPKPGSV